MTPTDTIVQKLWNYCDVLRDAGLSYQDYIEQLTFLLFLKMAEERTKLYPQEKPLVPEGYDWPSLVKLTGDELETHYRHILDTLGKSTGLLGTIFRKATNKIQEPAMLHRLIVELIDKENWLLLDTDVKGAAYEGLLAKNAEDVKSGAGQYFTPRPLIDAIVDVMRPEPKQDIIDPAAGTGGFLLSAHRYIQEHNKLDKGQKKHLRDEAFTAIEIVDGAARLCAMNLYLHGLGGKGTPVEVKDSLTQKSSKEYDMVLTNPPFGRASSITYVTDEGKEAREKLVYARQDFWQSTSNKQLNFLQHVYSLLEINGRAAIVVPDNVLFEGGAGERIRKSILKTCDVHTLLRLPTGIFYKQGVKANVLFFERKAASKTAWTKELWIYDFRTNMHFTLKTKSLKRSDLDDFVKSYNPENRQKRKETERFKCFKYDDLIKRDKLNLDIFWLKDESLEDSANLPDPDVIAQEIAEDLQAALEQFSQIANDLKG